MRSSQSLVFRELVEKEKPLQVVGTINAYTALMAKRIGFEAIYLSGAGVANCSYGLPDLGMTTLDNVLEDVNRILSVVSLPMLVDIDTGWGSSFMIDRAVKAMIRAGVAAIHLEDQVFVKRCGHRQGKAIVSKEEMVDRIKAAVDARTDQDFVIMARTDALASEGLETAIDRAISYQEAGADMLFPEAVTELEQYTLFKKKVSLPVLANITEFGQSPLFNIEELARAGVDIALYPLSASRAMNLAASRVFQEIRDHGTQKSLLEQMQTREELYGFLDYENYEQKANRVIQKTKS